LWLTVPGEQYKKIKSRGSSVFNYINEFIIERILFFGNTTNRVKQSKVNELYTYKLNSSIKIVRERWSKQNQSVWMQKIWYRNTRRTEIPIIRDWSLTGVKRKKLPASDSGWVSIHSCEAVKGVRVDNGFQGNSTIMKGSAKKHSLSGFEAMQIAESLERRKW